MREIAKQYNKTELKLFKAMQDLGLIFFSQQPIYVSKDRGYVADFAFPSVRVVVELDGIHWHERTAGQRAKTERKNEDLTALGYTVLHFTDERVNREAKQVAQEIFETVREKWNKMPGWNFLLRPWRE